MQKISPANRLKYEIERLEELQSIQGRQLKEQFYMTYESLKPINLLKNTLKDISNSPYLIDNIIGTGMGMVSGFLTKKIFVGVSGSMFRKLIGFGVTVGCYQCGGSKFRYHQVVRPVCHSKVYP